MLDRKEIEDSIEKMERQFHSYNEVEKLAHLYAIYDRNFPETDSDEEKELQEIFPALRIYQAEQSEINLERLCGEVYDFILALFASTRNRTQRQIIRGMLDRCMDL